MNYLITHISNCFKTEHNSNEETLFDSEDDSLDEDIDFNQITFDEVDGIITLPESVDSANLQANI